MKIHLSKNSQIFVSSRYLKFIVPLVVLLGATISHAQNTSTLFGTIADTSSQIWAGATWIATLNVPGGGNPTWIASAGGGPAPRSYTGQLTASGAFPATTPVVGRNDLMAPIGTSWQFTFFSLTSAPGLTISVPFTITTTTFSASAFLQFISPPIVPASNLSFAYNAGEVINAVQGNAYTNTISNTSFLWSGSQWVAFGGGGAGCTGPTGNFSLNNQVATLASGCVSSIGNPFGVSISCTAQGTFETGFATTNPNTCTFGYSNGTAASGTLTDSSSHTTTLTTPFTSGILAFAYTTNQTYTVNAVSTTSQNASASTTSLFLNREFAGIGTAGATGATASGTSAVLVGATGTLASAGLGTQNTYGPFTPANQKIYVLGLNSSCTFTSGGFAFPMNAPVSMSFTNQYGSVIPMYRYESTNLVSATFTLNGTC